MNVPSDVSVDETDGQPLWPVREGETLVDDYVAWQRLGVGHRCETWLAWCPVRWTPVAVKLARPAQVDHPRARAAVTREAEWLHRVAHPGFPRLLADGHAAPVPHLVTEYLEGLSLTEAIDEGPFGTDDAVLLLLQLAASVRHLHQLGVAHLDVKPDNVILHDGRPMLLDLGSVRPLGHLQAPGPPMGSPGHASPDLESGEPIDPRMDVYGLGVVLLHALLGFAPFDPDLAAVDRPDPATLLSSIAEADRPLGGVAAELLAASSAHRPASIEATMHMLTDHLPTPEHAPWPRWADSALTPTGRFRRTQPLPAQPAR